MSIETHVVHEISPLADSDALYIADRHKEEFVFPIHDHDVYELNFVENAAGVRRIIGDNSEIIGDYDLVLITSNYLSHVWEQNECHSKDIHEITVQFKFGLDENDFFFSKTPFEKIRQMLKRAQRGLSFPLKAIMKVYDRMVRLSQIVDPLSSLMMFISILNDLALSDGAKVLASSSFAKVEVNDDSDQILAVKNYILQHYMTNIKLEDMASMVNMSKSTFSRFFKLHTGRCLTDYIVEVRIGYAARKLLYTEDSVSNISYDVGFNNLSNFNRAFRKQKGCTPSEFRQIYHKRKVIIW